MNPLQSLRDWCRRPSKIRLSEGREPIVVGVPYKRGVIVASILTLFEDNWRARDPKGWKTATDQATCPECDGDEVVFDTLELYNFPVEATCKRCGHKWWYTPPYASYRIM